MDHLRLEEPNFNMKTYGQRAFSVAAPRLWNKLPFEIQACPDVDIFKSKLKTFLFKMVYDIQFHHICFFLFLFFCLCLMIFLRPFLHCKVLRTEMYKRYINSIIIIIIIMWLKMTNCDTMVSLLLDVQLSKIQFPDTA